MIKESLGKRELNRINNRKAIITAARDCFSEKGYDQVTVRDIIRRTGLASGTFYNYFQDKQSIFSALLSDYIERLSKHLFELRKSSDSLEKFIHSTYLAVFTAISEDPVVYQLAHSNNRVIRDLFGESIIGTNIATLEEDIEEAIQRGVIPEIDSTYLSAAFFGVAYEIGLRVANTSIPEPKVAATFATGLFMGGIKEISRETLLSNAPSPEILTQ